MKILFTGASSFTGYWFVRELTRAGHEVWATFTVNGIDAYDGIRADRVRKLLNICKPVWSCPFGSEKFLDLINQEEHWDVLCHHAADVRNYKSIDFDISSALSANTHNIQNVLKSLKEQGCQKVILTGSVFEQNEGAGEAPIRAFSPYGLSKGLTAEVFRFWCEALEFKFGKFVIPNPFGPMEEPRFTSYLINTWFKGEKAGVKTPAYIRDNIHISLLALSYCDFLKNMNNINLEFQKLNPSGYVESQGAFTLRFADEIKKRLDLPCEVELAKQVEYEEPKVRINTDLPDIDKLLWNEADAWDALADYYLSCRQA